MRISILHYAAPPIVGGVESTIYHHARLLTQANYQVSIIAGRGKVFNNQIPFIQVPEIDSRHPQVIKVGQDLANGMVNEEFIELRDKLYQELISNLDSSDVLIVHNVITLHKNLALTAALKLISERGKPPLLSWCHDFAWQDKLYTPDLHPGYPWDLLRTPWPGIRYITVSDHRRQRLAELLNIPDSSIEVIPPGIDVFQFLNLSPFTQEIVNRLQLLDADPLVLLPARITRRKNIEFGIQVIKSLINLYPDVSLVVTGPPGPHNPKNIAYLNSLRTLREELQVESNIHFLYELNGEDQVLNIPDEIIAELYRLADIIIFPSHREGFGIPVLEAGLARTPIFAADIPSVRESSTGLINLFNPNGDPQTVASDIQNFLKSDRGYQLRKQVLNQYTWQSILKKQIIPILDEFGPLKK
jgi:glycosyltransferase involved in cell wall biosynthesis